MKYEEYDNQEFMLPLLRQLAARRRAFEVLGLPEDASVARIKAAFRRQVKRLHPDVEPPDPKAHAKLQLLLAAYKLLTGREEASPLLFDAEITTVLPELTEPYSSWWWRHFFEM